MPSLISRAGWAAEPSALQRATGKFRGKNTERGTRISLSLLIYIYSCLLHVHLHYKRTNMNTSWLGAPFHWGHSMPRTGAEREGKSTAEMSVGNNVGEHPPCLESGPCAAPKGAGSAGCPLMASIWVFQSIFGISEPALGFSPFHKGPP